MSGSVKVVCTGCGKPEIFNRHATESCLSWTCICGKINDFKKGSIGNNPNEPAVAASVEATLAQRGSRYGDFTDHARVCQSFKACAVMAMPESSGRGFENLSDVQKQALEVIFDKIARILTGDPNYDDNWHDIQGYAKLVEDRLPKESK